MKKISLLAMFALLCVTIFVGCEEEDTFPFETKGATIVATNIGFFNFYEINTTTFDFNVSSLGEALSSVKVMKSYNGGTPVLHGTITQTPVAVSITAAEAVQGLGISVSDLQLGDKIVFTFEDVQTGSGTYPSLESITANVACPSSLAGEYTVTTTYNYHDFLPDFNPHTLDVVEIEEIGTGKYKIFDFSGGLYSIGPYTTYGTTDLQVEFSDVCNEIIWQDQSDPWGALVPLEGGVNSVDPTTGVITISWFCEGYGENGVSVYTPL